MVVRFDSALRMSSSLSSIRYRREERSDEWEELRPLMVEHTSFTSRVNLKTKEKNGGGYEVRTVKTSATEVGTGGGGRGFKK